MDNVDTPVWSTGEGHAERPGYHPHGSSLARKRGESVLRSSEEAPSGRDLERFLTRGNWMQWEEFPPEKNHSLPDRDEMLGGI